jgi:hypothetical protein
MQPFGRIGVARSRVIGPSRPAKGIVMKTKIKTAALPTGLPVTLQLAGAALVLALLAIPHIGHAQGIVRGAQEGAYEGNRIAGPVGGAVGTAVGAAASAAPWAPWMACSGFRIVAIGATAAASMIATIISTAIGRLSPPSLRGANGSRECAPDDRLRDEAIHGRKESVDCFVASAFARRRASAGKSAPLRKRFAFVAGNDGWALSRVSSSADTRS